MNRIFTLIGLFFLSGIFLASAQSIPNSGFETWTNVNLAANWKSNNKTNLSPNLNYVRQSADMHSGSFAAEIISSAADWSGSAAIISGILTVGAVDIYTQTISGGLPINSKPTDLHGWYKYTAGNGAENMRVTVIMTKWTGTSRLTLFNGSFNSPVGQSVNTYTQFTLPITYTPSTITPDTFNIVIKSSANGGNVATRLLVDDLAFTPATTGVEEMSEFIPTMWPNPANEKFNLNLNGEEYNILVTNLIGQNVFNATTSNEKISVNTSNLPTGIYYVNVSNKKRHYTMKLLISR